MPRDHDRAVTRIQHYLFRPTEPAEKAEHSECSLTIDSESVEGVEQEYTTQREMVDNSGANTEALYVIKEGLLNASTTTRIPWRGER